MTNDYRPIYLAPSDKARIEKLRAQVRQDAPDWEKPRITKGEIVRRALAIYEQYVQQVDGAIGAPECEAK